jgi:hypothetical protein
MRQLLGVGLAMAVLCPATASALPGSGPHETVDIRISTTHTNTSTALTYAATYHAANNPQGDPPSLRRLVIRADKGLRIDTTVRPECRATDAEFKNKGKAACAAASNIGSGFAKLKTLGLFTSRFDTTIFNAPRAQAEIVQSGGKTFGVARTFFRNDGTAEGPVPTCITGGNPPDGCPTDELALLSQSLTTPAISTGHGAHRRNYLTTPKTCPRTRVWRTPVTLHYADGTVETVVTRQPCIRAKVVRHHHHRRHHHRPGPRQSPRFTG